MKHSEAFLTLVEAAKRQIREVDLDACRELLQQDPPALLIDVREDHEVAQGTPLGAIHLGRGILERDIVAREPDLDREIVLLCGGGYRSALAAESMGKMGYRRVSSLVGGWKAWVTAGLPVTKP